MFIISLPSILITQVSAGTDLRRRGAWSGDKHEMSDSADLQLTTDRSYSEERRRRHWRWAESQREGRCLRPGISSCRWVSYHCGGRSALILYFLAFQNFLIKLLSCFASSHSTIVKLCKKMHISGLRPTFPIGKYEK